MIEGFKPLENHKYIKRKINSNRNHTKKDISFSIIPPCYNQKVPCKIIKTSKLKPHSMCKLLPGSYVTAIIYDSLSL